MLIDFYETENDVMIIAFMTKYCIVLNGGIVHAYTRTKYIFGKKDIH